MKNDDFIRVTEDVKKRYYDLKRSCDGCVPDELLIWIDEVMESKFFEMELVNRLKMLINDLFRKKELDASYVRGQLLSIWVDCVLKCHKWSDGSK